jgi:hypothetical protein
LKFVLSVSPTVFVTVGAAGISVVISLAVCGCGVSLHSNEFLTSMDTTLPLHLGMNVPMLESKPSWTTTQRRGTPGWRSVRNWCEGTIQLNVRLIVYLDESHEAGNGYRDRNKDTRPTHLGYTLFRPWMQSLLSPQGSSMGIGKLPSSRGLDPFCIAGLPSIDHITAPGKVNIADSSWRDVKESSQPPTA